MYYEKFVLPCQASVCVSISKGGQHTHTHARPPLQHKTFHFFNAFVSTILYLHILDKQAETKYPCFVFLHEVDVHPVPHMEKNRMTCVVLSIVSIADVFISLTLPVLSPPYIVDLK